MHPLRSLLAIAALLLLIQTTALADTLQRSKGQTIYVPAYSHVFTGPRSNPFNLAITLSVRNTDQGNAITLSAIDYLDTNGKLVRRHLARPQTLAPLASYFIHLEEKDTSGGFAPKFIVRWEANRQVTAPIVETLMIGATSGQGISFIGQGQVLQER